MKRFRILFGCCLLLLMSAMVFAGGGQPQGPANWAPNRSNFNPSSFARVPANYTIGVLTISHDGTIVADDHPAMVRLQEYTGVRINLQYVLNANFAEQINTRLAGGDLPGIVTLTGTTEPIIVSARSGAFWDITDVYTMYPNLARADLNVMNNISIDGRFFGFYRERVVARAGMIYRSDWLANVGLAVPRTLDDLYRVLHAFTYNDPDRNGLHDTFGMAWTGFYMGPFYDLAVMHGAPHRFGIRNGQLTPWFEYDEFYEAMLFSKRLYDEGLINRDFAALQTSEWAQPIGRGNAGWHIDVADEGSRTATRLRDNGFMDQAAFDRGELVWVMGSVANSRGQIFSRANNAGHQGFVFISTTGARTLQDLHYHLDFMDKLNSDVGQALLNNGLEGFDYNFNPDGTITGVPSAEQPLAWNHRTGMNQFRMMSDRPLMTNQNLYQLRHEEVYLENARHIVHDPTIPLAMSSPTWTSRAQSLNQLIDDAVINFIMGNLDQAGWRREVARWYNEDGRRALEELQAAYNATR